MRSHRAIWLLLLCAIGPAGLRAPAGAGPRTRASRLTADLARADAPRPARLHMPCLQDALAIYERLAATGRRPAAELRAIDTALLLALQRARTRPGRRAVPRTRRSSWRAASRRPSTSACSCPWRTSQPWHAGRRAEGAAGRACCRRSGRCSSRGRRWRAQLAARRGAGPAAGLLTCSPSTAPAGTYSGRWRRAALAASRAARRRLLRFRAAVCPLALDRRGPGSSSRRATPRFAEAHLFLGEAGPRAALTLRTAEKHLAEAVRAMPELPPAWLLLGHVHLAIEELDLARDALPSRQRRRFPASARRCSARPRASATSAATRRRSPSSTRWSGSAPGTWGRCTTGARGTGTASRSTTPRTTTCWRRGSGCRWTRKVDALAGFIALARHEVERAEGEFRLAVQHYEGRGERDCDSGYYLASTLVMQRKWADAAPVLRALRALLRPRREGHSPAHRHDQGLGPAGRPPGPAGGGEGTGDPQAAPAAGALVLQRRRRPRQPRRRREGAARSPSAPRRTPR
ncbi:MAG: hypothetical protein MZW92_24950 [Comamonadaceae bacterium]|nr:hypothetical protein [Comamonadaceae bacterium]